MAKLTNTGFILCLVIIIGIAILYLDKRESKNHKDYNPELNQKIYDSLQVVIDGHAQKIKEAEEEIDSLEVLVEAREKELAIKKQEYNETKTKNLIRADSVFSLNDTATVKHLSEWLNAIP